MAGHPPRGRPPTTPAARSPHRACKPRGKCRAPPARTPVPTARGWRTPTARPVGGQWEEGERLTSDAPHNGGRHPPADAFPSPPPRATPARRGTRFGDGAGSPRSHRQHPGHTGRGTPAARPRGRAAGRGTAPDTRRPSQQWQASPPGTAPHQPRGTQPPKGMQAEETVPAPHTRTPAPTARGWRTPTARPEGGRSGKGERLTSDAPHNGKRRPPWVTPLRHLQGGQRQPSRAHVVGPVLGPHACTDCTRDTRVAEPRLPAPGDGRPGGGQRLTPDAPHNGGRPPCLGTAPHHPRGTQPPQGVQAKGTVLGPHTRPTAPTARGWRTPTARPEGGQSGEGDLRRPSQRRTAPQSGTPFRHPTASNACPQGRALSGRCWVPTPAPTAPGLAAPEDGRLGEGQCLTPDAPQNSGKPPLPGTAPDHPRSTQPLTTAKGALPGDATPPSPQRATPARKGARCGAAAGSPRLHRPHPGHMDRGTPIARPRGRAAGGGTAPDTRSPSQRWQANPPGTTPHHPRGTQPPQGMQAKATVLGPDTRTPAPTARGWRTPTARPVSGQSREGERLTSDAPCNGDRHLPRGRPSATLTASNASPQGRTVGPVPGPQARTGRTKGTRVVEPRLPAPEEGQPGKGERLTSDAPHNGKRHPSPGRPSATPTASNAGPQGHTLTGRCRVPTPAPTARGTHGSLNPGCPPQRKGGRGRDSA